MSDDGFIGPPPPSSPQHQHVDAAGMENDTSSHSLVGPRSYKPILDDNSTQRTTTTNDEGTEMLLNHVRRSLKNIDQNYIKDDADIDLETGKIGPEQLGCADIDGIDAEGKSSQHNDNRDDERNQDLFPSLVYRRKKKVKNRHVKAAIMIAVIWTIMVGFIVISLSVEWWSNAWRDRDSCTLCGKDFNLEMQDIELTDWPTRKPSSKGSDTSSLFTFLGSPSSLRPPPENIAQVCAPSIYLDYGPGSAGPSVDDLVATCANTCFPAMCCLINDEQAKLGITAVLESQGLGSQAISYISSIKNCYTDDNIAACDQYSRWCDTLYRLDVVLENTIRKEIESSCVKGSADFVVETSRAFGSDNLQKDCSLTCNSVTCCYEAVQKSTETDILRKRKRQHIYFNSDLEVEGKPRMQLSSGFCQNFTLFEGSLNAKICDAYAPYCNPHHSSLSIIQIPSVTRPTFHSPKPMFTSNTSDFDSSYSPTAIIPSSSPTTSVYPSSYTMVSTSSQNASTWNSSQPTSSLSSRKSRTPTGTRFNATSSPGPSPMIFDIIGTSEIPNSSTSLNITSWYAPSQQLGSYSMIPTSDTTEPSRTRTTSTELSVSSPYITTQHLGKVSLLPTSGVTLWSQTQTNSTSLKNTTSSHAPS